MANKPAIAGTATDEAELPVWVVVPAGEVVEASPVLVVVPEVPFVGVVLGVTFVACPLAAVW